MINSTKLVIAVVLASVAVAGLVLYHPRATVPLDRQILESGHIKLLAEGFPLDGGSRVFFFQLPQGRSMALEVHNRDPRFDGNPDFQEIWLSSDGNFKTYIVLQQRSPLEQRVLDLLENASCEPTSLPFFSRPARPEMLSWIIEDRIKDRKSTWDKATAP